MGTTVELSAETHVDMCEGPLMGVSKEDATSSAARVVSPERNRFPFCIVWSPLPLITWFIPFIGHMGIATSDGIIYDFAGPYTIGREHFAFGAPTRYIQCDVKADQVEKWDQSVERGCSIYETRMHNLFCDNCHSHVATCLEHMQYRGIKRWNMVMLCFWMFFRGKYVDPVGFLKSWIPFVLVVIIIYFAV
ncbi:hypothetical protein Poli38472_002809 [Pythium oligandrum]|uniref:Transmembrane protein 222 n=1 Tax=Pythium oligandrum TaxID=41045 RepID=A0A8K1C5L3_PYTOL|nr:hypothetical protein Poli38472_002809 [Pythium oligandrum]|eukprot:TMW56884.1 hypothetical protein Poli38472_002809 [Pythium oligandrum]